MFRYDEPINPIHCARMLWKGDDAVNCSNDSADRLFRRCTRVIAGLKEFADNPVVKRIRTIGERPKGTPSSPWASTLTAFVDRLSITRTSRLQPSIQEL